MIRSQLFLQLIPLRCIPVVSTYLKLPIYKTSCWSSLSLLYLRKMLIFSENFTQPPIKSIKTFVLVVKENSNHATYKRKRKTKIVYNSDLYKEANENSNKILYNSNVYYKPLFCQKIKPNPFSSHDIAPEMQLALSFIFCSTFPYLLLHFITWPQKTPLFILSASGWVCKKLVNDRCCVFQFCKGWKWKYKCWLLLEQITRQISLLPDW